MDEIFPEPSYQEYSGKFNVRLPRSLHRALVDAASQDGVSLNQYVVMLLSSGNTLAQLKGQRVSGCDARKRGGGEELAGQPAV